MMMYPTPRISLFVLSSVTFFTPSNIVWYVSLSNGMEVGEVTDEVADEVADMEVDKVANVEVDPGRWSGVKVKGPVGPGVGVGGFGYSFDF